MAVSGEDMAVIDEALAAPNAEAGAFAALRLRLPHLAWTRCDAGDVAETPFRAYPTFDLHLLDGADHCVQLTSDPARATGVVLARRGSS